MPFIFFATRHRGAPACLLDWEHWRAANHPRRFARELAVAPIKHPASEPAGIDFERITDALEGKWPISLSAKKPPLGIGE
jgi:hypothetical protein